MAEENIGAKTLMSGSAAGIGALVGKSVSGQVAALGGVGAASAGLSMAAVGAGSYFASKYVTESTGFDDYLAGTSPVRTAERLLFGKIPSNEPGKKIHKLTTVGGDGDEDLTNWPRMYIYEYIPAFNMEWEKMARRAIDGTIGEIGKSLLGAIGKFIPATEMIDATIGQGTERVGQLMQAASRADHDGFEKGTKHIKDIFGPNIRIFHEYEIPCKDLKFINVDTTGQWSTDGLYQGDFAAKLSRNVPTMPIWKAEALSSGQGTINFDITLVNRTYKDAYNNRQMLINLASGMYWSQSDSTQVSPHVYKVFIGPPNIVPPTDPHALDGRSLAEYGIMWYMEWAALAMTVDYVGQLRDGLPEEYKIQIKVKPLVPECLNTTVFGWDHRRTAASAGIRD